MATLTFNDVKDNSEMMIIIAPENKIYKGYYCDPKLDRTTLPEGWYSYDIRTDDDGCGIFCELTHDYVYVNSAGSFFTQHPIEELSKEGSFVNFKIDPEEWKEAHSNPEELEEIENYPDDWEYSFEDWEEDTEVVEEKNMVEGVTFLSDEEVEVWKNEHKN